MSPVQKQVHPLKSVKVRSHLASTTSTFAYASGIALCQRCSEAKEDPDLRAHSHQAKGTNIKEILHFLYRFRSV